MLLLTLPALVAGTTFVALALALGCAHRPRWHQDTLWASWRPWLSKRWFYSTTVGRGICMHPSMGDSIAAHEMVHVRQSEDNALLALVLGALCWDARVALVLWASSPAWLLIGYAAALLRYGPAGAYREAEHERAAYAQNP